MTKWSNPECETLILIKLLLSKTYIFIVFLICVSPLVHDAIHLFYTVSMNPFHVYTTLSLNIYTTFLYIMLGMSEIPYRPLKPTTLIFHL